MKHISRRLIIISLIMLTVLSLFKTANLASAESVYRWESCSIKAKNGDEITIEVMVFADESGLYWKKTETGFQLYRHSEDGDDNVGWSYGYLKMGDSIYCISDNVRTSGFIPVYNRNQAIDDYWLYFNEEGKLQGNIRAYGLFDVEESGLYIYKNSELYHDLNQAMRNKYIELYSSDDYIEQQIAYRTEYLRADSSKLTDKEIRAKVKKEIKSDIEDVKKHNYASEYTTDQITDILNRTGSTGAGKETVKKEGAKKPEYYKLSVKGQWEKTENGKTKYYCNKAVEKTALISMYVFRNNRISKGVYYNYFPLDKYDWVDKILFKDEYVTNHALKIDGKYYVFDHNGYMITNKWIYTGEDSEINFDILAENTSDSEECEYIYVGKDGIIARNQWVKKDGVKRHLNEDGRMDYNTWVKDKNRGYWVNGDGKLDPSRTNNEYKVAMKLVKMQDKYPQYSNVGSCQSFMNKAIKFVFGTSAKGKTYKYDWNKIKVGDTIAFTLTEGYSHIGMVMAKNEDMITLVDSNYDGDNLAYYGRTVISKDTLDKKGNGWAKNFVYTTYYK